MWKRHGFTALLVMHDVAEAMALADRVLRELARDEGESIAETPPLPGAWRWAI